MNTSDLVHADKSRAIEAFGGVGFGGVPLMERFQTDRGERLVSVEFRAFERNVLDLYGPVAERFNPVEKHTVPSCEPREYCDVNALCGIGITRFVLRRPTRSILSRRSISIQDLDEVAMDKTSPPMPISDCSKFMLGWGGAFTRLGLRLDKGSFRYPKRKDTIGLCIYVGDWVGLRLAVGGRRILNSVQRCVFEPLRDEGIVETVRKGANSYPKTLMVPAGGLKSATANLLLSSENNPWNLSGWIEKLTAYSNILVVLVEAAMSGPRDRLQSSLKEWKTADKGEFV